MILFDNEVKIKWEHDNSIESKMKEKTWSSISNKLKVEGQNWRKKI
jgi:hypothetical protein